MQALRLLVAEEKHLIRGALVNLLETERDLQVVASIGRGDMVIPTVQECKPDVAIIDLDISNASGLTLAERIHETLPSCRTVVLAGSARPGIALRARTAKVAGLLLKTAPPERLPEAVREVASGRAFVDPYLAKLIWDAEENPLSEREVEVLKHVAQGAEPIEIAAALRLSIGTIRNYLTAILTKLNARNKVDAIRIALENGWLP
ncbi:DNA-binding response regulator [Streptomyces sp. NPDC059455]|uniref:response regulator transcription factor n=1 Tax=Streptomyces sp. NPDC059455 TaxID=3346837 RepID=UPI0036B04162